VLTNDKGKKSWCNDRCVLTDFGKREEPEFFSQHDETKHSEKGEKNRTKKYLPIMMLVQWSGEEGEKRRVLHLLKLGDPITVKREKGGR